MKGLLQMAAMAKMAHLLLNLSPMVTKKKISSQRKMRPQFSRMKLMMKKSQVSSKNKMTYQQPPQRRMPLAKAAAAERVMNPSRRLRMMRCKRMPLRKNQAMWPPLLSPPRLSKFSLHLLCSNSSTWSQSKLKNLRELTRVLTCLYSTKTSRMGRLCIV